MIHFFCNLSYSMCTLSKYLNWYVLGRKKGPYMIEIFVSELFLGRCTLLLLHKVPSVCRLLTPVSNPLSWSHEQCVVVVDGVASSPQLYSLTRQSPKTTKLFILCSNSQVWPPNTFSLSFVTGPQYCLPRCLCRLYCDQHSK